MNLEAKVRSKKREARRITLQKWACKVTQEFKALVFNSILKRRREEKRREEKRREEKKSSLIVNGLG